MPDRLATLAGVVAACAKGDACQEAVDFFTTPRILLPTQLHRNVGFHAFNLYFLTHKVHFMTASLDRLVEYYRKGALKPLIGGTYRLSEAVQVHELLQSRKAIGKIVMIP